MQKVIFRADGNSALGLGHITRCLQLAKNLKSKYSVEILFVHRKDENISGTIRTAGFETKAIPTDASESEELGLLNEYGSRDSVVVIDLLRVTDAYLERAKNQSARMVVLDDQGGHVYPADLVVGQYFDSKKEQYRSEGQETRFLLGAEYVLLNPEYKSGHSSTKDILEQPKKVLVTFGGSDPKNLTLKAIKALESSEYPFEITVILGSSNQNESSIRSAVSDATHKITIKKNVKNLSAEMSDADIAFCNVGNTAYELACLGVPTLLVTARREQTTNAVAFEELGIHRFVGLGAESSEEKIVEMFNEIYTDPKLRRTMSKNGKHYVDGQGLDRVTEAIGSLIKEHSVL